MKKTLSHIPALFLVLGAFLLSAPSVHAATFNLPMQFTYAGLTFVEPLNYSNKAPLQKETLTFSIPEKLAITETTDSQTITAEIVLLPTITAAMTLPVLPTQQPPAAFKDEQGQEETEDTDAPTPTPKLLTKVYSTNDPTPTPTAVPVTTAPVVTAATNTSTPGGLDAEKLFNMSNAYRQSQGLAPFQKDARACSLAASRAPEIAGEIAGGHMHSGLRARALPYWNSENIISMRTEESAFNWWVNDKIHHDAIVGNYTYSCVACSGNSCAQEFTNFQAK